MHHEKLQKQPELELYPAKSSSKGMWYSQSGEAKSQEQYLRVLHGSAVPHNTDWHIQDILLLIGRTNAHVNKVHQATKVKWEKMWDVEKETKKIVHLA